MFAPYCENVRQEILGEGNVLQNFPKKNGSHYQRTEVLINITVWNIKNT